MELRRPHPTSDFDEVLALVQACDRAVYGDSDWTRQELREEWDDMDLDLDAWVAVEKGVVAGLIHVSDVRGGRIITDGYVHPSFAGRGVGTLLLDVVEERARELEPGIASGLRVYLETAHLVGDPGAPTLLSGRGFERVRTFFRMVRLLQQPERDPVLPDGCELRPFDPELHAARLHAAFEESFRDEWGHQAQVYSDWYEKVIGWARFDPTLVPVVWSGDEITAFSLNYEKRMGDWGWIGSLAVIPAWRRRGLGLALLQESFRRFAGRGETTVALGVDSENPTSATLLYERAGMHVLWRADVWQKELRGATAG